MAIVGFPTFVIEICPLANRGAHVCHVWQAKTSASVIWRAVEVGLVKIKCLKLGHSLPINGCLANGRLQTSPTQLGKPPSG